MTALPFVVCILSASTGCRVQPDPRQTNFRVERGNLAAQYDEHTGRLKKLEIDRDNDGKIDTWTYMNDTRIERIEIDRDENGKIERWEYYIDGRLEKVGASSRGDGIVDEWAFQRPGGTLMRVESDSNRDGQIDKWELFDEPTAPNAVPTLRAVELDPDSAGRPTRRLVYGPDGSLERIERPRDQPSTGVPSP